MGGPDTVVLSSSNRDEFKPCADLELCGSAVKDTKEMFVSCQGLEAEEQH